MKKRTDGILILRGYSWGWVALAFVFMLLTPLWVALAASLGGFEAVIGAVLLPSILFGLTWKDYDNWQLVLQADYGEGAIYKAPWGYRQKVTGFDLATLDKAVLDSEYRGLVDGFWGKREEYVYHLALTYHGASYKRRVGIGSEGHVLSMASHVNGWLSTQRHIAALNEKKCA